MRIISNFRDYYDPVQGLGIDKTLVYARTTQTLHLREWNKPTKKELTLYINKHFRDIYKVINPTPYRSWEDDTFVKERTLIGHFYEIEVLIFGFCGKVYLGFRLQVRNPENQGLIGKVVYTLGDIVKELQKYEHSLSNRQNRYRATTSPEVLTNLIAFNGKDIDQTLFHQFKTPCFLIDGNNFVISPVLRDLNFHRFKDPYTAYQEISMYLGGVLGQAEAKTVDIKDKDMLYKKGFDNTSFKTVSPGKKFNRRNK